LPHEYERGGTAKLLTLFRPATGQIRAKGVVSVTNAVLHPWLKEQLSAVLAEIEQKQPADALPPEAERPWYAQWEAWLGHPHARPSRPCASCWCWIIWRGICPMTWSAGSSSMG
jgi:hypothetical protein